MVPFITWPRSTSPNPGFAPSPSSSTPPGCIPWPRPVGADGRVRAWAVKAPLPSVAQEVLMLSVSVTGATGVSGRATIPLLRALYRVPSNDAAIRALRAEPVRGALFDIDSLKCAMAGADAVLHLISRIPTPHACGGATLGS